MATLRDVASPAAGTDRYPFQTAQDMIRATDAARYILARIKDHQDRDTKATIIAALSTSDVQDLVDLLPSLEVLANYAPPVEEIVWGNPSLYVQGDVPV